MTPQAAWSPTAHAFAHHQFSHVANFWKQGRQASFRLEALPGGRAELNLTFQLPPASEVVPPPSKVLPVPAPQRHIPPLFPEGGFPHVSGADSNKTKYASKKASSKQRKSYQRSVLHRASLAASSLPPPKNGSLRQAALACVQRQQAVSASPVAKKRPLPDSPSALSPSNLSPLSQRIRKDIQIGESEAESPEKEILRSPPYLENSPAPFSPCMKDIPSPASLVFTPVPPERLELNCSNCEEPMSSTHQCCVAVPSSPFLAQPPAGVKMTFSDGRSRRVNMMKFCDNCDTLFPVATGCQSCLTHVEPP